MSARPRINPDRPVESRESDLFRRTPYAVAIAQEILAAPLEAGFVVGILGPWGSGKSSMLNLMAEELEAKGAVVVRFNPWLFSGTEQLVEMFFGELAAQLRVQDDEGLKKLGERLEQYGEALSPLKYVPVIGAVADAVTTVAKGAGQMIRQRGDKSIVQRRDELESALREAGKRIVILVDDIDRLHRQEVRDIVRLVRLTADFPNCVYVLAFDRERVERHLDDEPSEGRAYLEKILQVTHHVPRVRETDLARLVAEGIEAALAGRATVPVDMDEMKNIFNLVIRPLFRTPRDIGRYLSALPLALEVMGVEVAPVDTVALEAVRVLRPDVFNLISRLVVPLTQVREHMPELPGRIEAVAKIFEVAGADAGAMRELLRRQFPASRRYFDNYHAAHWQEAEWGTQRRVAHRRVLEFYLEKSYPEDILPEAIVHGVYQDLEDAGALKERVGAMDSRTLEQLLERLHDYHGRFTAEQTRVAVPVLMNQLPRLRCSEGGFADFFSPEVHLIRVVLRMLEQVHEQEERDRIVTASLGEIESLSARLELVRSVGAEKNVGLELVAPETAKAMEQALLAAVLGGELDALATERDIERIVDWVSEHESEEVSAWLAKVLEKESAVWALLRRLRYVPKSLAFGDVAEKMGEARLHWEFFEKVFADGSAAARCGQLAMQADAQESDVELLALAKKYATGWRPPSRH